MQLKNYSVEKLKKELRSIIASRLDIDTYKLFFFGSRVKGEGSDRSDIDLGIDGPAPVKATVMAEIREAIENLRLLYTIDVVDFYQVSDEVRTEALKYVEEFGYDES